MSLRLVLFLLAYGGFLFATGDGAVTNFNKLFARMVPPQAIGGFPLDLWGFAAGLAFRLRRPQPLRMAQRQKAGHRQHGDRHDARLHRDER